MEDIAADIVTIRHVPVYIHHPVWKERGGGDPYMLEYALRAQHVVLERALGNSEVPSSGSWYAYPAGGAGN